MEAIRRCFSLASWKSRDTEFQGLYNPVLLTFDIFSFLQVSQLQGGSALGGKKTLDSFSLSLLNHKKADNSVGFWMVWRDFKTTVLRFRTI